MRLVIIAATLVVAFILGYFVPSAIAPHDLAAQMVIAVFLGLFIGLVGGVVVIEVEISRE